MEAGLDSLAATELVARLRPLFGVELSLTLIFEHPTSRAMAMHVLERMSLGSAPKLQIAGSAQDASATPSLISAAVGNWPGGCIVGSAKLELKKGCGDAVSTVPSARWTLADDLLRTLTSTQDACVRHGGFIVGAQVFDGKAFAVSPAEAAAVDPQQRMLLESAYSSLHMAAYRRVELVDSDCGVFLGIERPDWALAKPPRVRDSVYAPTGDNVSVAAGRVSFALGLQGPCVSVDTACASALAALHGAITSMQTSGCDTALALAVSLKLAPDHTLGGAGSGALSLDGRCKTLDARANGYVRSEGLGAMVLECLTHDSAVSVANCSVHQDGRSASLTAPNGSAQRKLLLNVLERGGSSPSQVSAVEAHGTGTALGDPTEASALAKVHASSDRSTPMSVNAAKASVGHAEAASGQIGLLKVHMLIKTTNLVGNAQLRVLNPLIGALLRNVSQSFALPTQTPLRSLMDAWGVSSFGFSGTITHSLLHYAGQPAPGRCAPPPDLVYTHTSYRWVSNKPSKPSEKAPTARPAGSAFKVVLTKVGALDNLKIQPQSLTYSALEQYDAKVEVQAAGLNFRDVLNALGLDPTGTLKPIGGEAAGMVITSGAACSHIHPGDHIFGMPMDGCLSTYARCDARYLGRMPNTLTFEQAATLPVVWTTAHYCMREALTHASRTVLVHAAAGGVGIVTSDWTHSMRARVYGSAGGVGKHAWLRLRKVLLAISSRNAAACGMQLATHLQGRTLDATVNSLSKDFIPLSLAKLACGTFLEIGKNNIWSRCRMLAAHPRADYVAVAVDEGCRNCPGWNLDPWWFSGELRQLTEGVNAGVVSPLPVEGFAFHEKSMQGAFRLLQRGANIGKVIVVVGDVSDHIAVQITISGRETVDFMIEKLSAVPPDKVLSIRLHSACLSEDIRLRSLFEARKAPIVTTCFGRITGRVTFLLGHSAKVLAHHTTIFAGELGGVIAAEALRNGIVDYEAYYEELMAELRGTLHLLRQGSADEKSTRFHDIPAPSVELSLLAVGSTDNTGRTRGRDVGSLVRVQFDSDCSVVVCELNDAQRFNTITHALGDDMRQAMLYLHARSGAVRALTLQGAGSTFCAGGNRYVSGPSSLAAAAKNVVDTFAGFFKMRELPSPIVCAMHGPMVGGAAAIFLHADVRIAESVATFQHGNLSRGVCPVAGFSRCLQLTIGTVHALECYLTDAVITSTQAMTLGLVHGTSVGICETKAHALQISRRMAESPLVPSVIEERFLVDAQLLASEALSHVECLKSNSGLITDNARGKGAQLASFAWSCAASLPASTEEPALPVQVLKMMGAMSLPTTLSACTSLACVHLQHGRQETTYLAVCQGELRGGSILMLCNATAVLAHRDTIVSFSGIGHGSGAGVESPTVTRRVPNASKVPRVVDAGAALRFGLVDFVGHESELGSEVTRLCRCMDTTVAQSSKQTDAVLVDADLRIDAKSGIAALTITDGRRAPVILEAAARWLSCGAVTVRALVLSFDGVVQVPLRGSARVLHRLKWSIKMLQSLGVPIVSSARGVLCELTLFAFLQADFRIADELLSTTTGQAAPAHAHLVPFVSEVVSDAEPRALRFAASLCQYPAIGLKSMLGLSRSAAYEGATSAQVHASLRATLLLCSTQAEKRICAHANCALGALRDAERRDASCRYRPPYRANCVLVRPCPLRWWCDEAPPPPPCTMPTVLLFDRVPSLL